MDYTNCSVKLNNLDLNKLHVFLQIVEHKGVSAAAQRLTLTRSAVSQALASLEGSLDVQLFNRVGKRLVLTAEGKRLYLGVKRYHDGLAGALQALERERTEVVGVVRVGSFPEFARAQLSELVADFLKAHPKAQVKLLFSSPSDLNKLLVENKIDLGFSIYPQDNKTTRSEAVFAEELVLVGTKKFHSKAQSLGELLKLPVIDYYQNSVLMKRWLEHNYRAGAVRLNVRAFAASADMALELIGRGAGIGVVPRYLAERLLKKGKLEVFETSRPPLIDYIWLNELKSSYKNPAYLAFRSNIMTNFGIKRSHASESNRSLQL